MHSASTSCVVNVMLGGRVRRRGTRAAPSIRVPAGWRGKGSSHTPVQAGHRHPHTRRVAPSLPAGAAHGPPLAIYLPCCDPPRTSKALLAKTGHALLRRRAGRRRCLACLAWCAQPQADLWRSEAGRRRRASLGERCVPARAPSLPACQQSKCGLRERRRQRNSGGATIKLWRKPPGRIHHCGINEVPRAVANRWLCVHESAGRLRQGRSKRCVVPWCSERRAWRKTGCAAPA